MKTPSPPKPPKPRIVYEDYDTLGFWEFCKNRTYLYFEPLTITYKWIIKNLRRK